MIKNIKEIINFNIEENGIITINEKNFNTICLMYEIEPLTIYEINDDVENNVKYIYKEFLSEIDFDIKIIIQNNKLDMPQNKFKKGYEKTLSNTYDKQIYLLAYIPSQNVDSVDNIVSKIRKIGINVNRIINKELMASIIYRCIFKRNIENSDNLALPLDILPNYINTKNFRNIEVDGKYISNVVVKRYPKKISFCQVFESLPTDIEFDISLIITKKDKNKILKDLTYKISSISSEIKTTNKNQIDIETLKKINDESLNLRKDIQVNDEEVYGVNLIFSFFDYDNVGLNYKVNGFKSKLFSKGIICNITNFRQEEFFLNTLPVKNISKKIKAEEILMTTTALSNMFCLYSKSVFDKNGIFLGYVSNENKVCNIDIFAQKYLNANICVIGSSGSGKSYFLKLLLLRMKQNIKKYIFDNEGEYSKLAYKEKETCIKFDIENSKQGMDIFSIKFNRLIVQKYVDKKIENIINLFKRLNNFSIEELKNLEQALEVTYEKVRINNINEENKINLNKLYVNGKKDKEIYISSNDLFENITSKKLKIKLESFFNKHPYFRGTNLISNMNMVIFDISSSLGDIRDDIILFLLDEIELELNYKDDENEKSVIVFDEIFKYIRKSGNNDVMHKILLLYKTIRKKEASVITITQDIEDFFSIANGEYGRIVMNNSAFKLFFRLSYFDKEFLDSISGINYNKIKEILSFGKGKVNLNFLNNNIVIDVVATEEEKALIEG